MGELYGMKLFLDKNIKKLHKIRKQRNLESTGTMSFG